MRIGSDWNHYHYTYGDEGRTAEVRFDVECAVAPCPPTHQCTIQLRLEGPEEDFEHKLPELLAEQDCWLVGILRYAGTTAFIFQVEDEPAFQSAMPKLVEACSGSLSSTSSAGWGFFDERVCPNAADWQRITDREQLARLAEAGVDCEAEQPIAHGFFGSSKSLDAIQARLEPEGYQVHRREDERLEMKRAERPNEVSTISVPLARFARSKGAAYDGWQPV